jgi:asparaginyl-tRNA synthetase
VERLKNIIEKPFTRITYTQAIEILQGEVAAGKVVFDEAVEWGMDMGSEHERYLAEKLFKGPVICTNYPKGIKAFYMKLDGERVHARVWAVLLSTPSEHVKETRSTSELLKP